MAKKEKIVIKDEPLVPTVIGFVDKKQVGLIYLFFVFVVLIAFTYFLPEITDYFDNSTVNNNVVYEEENSEEDILLYTSGMSIVGEYVTLENIILNDYTLTFDVVNYSLASVSLESLEVYLEIYDIEGNLIARNSFEDYIFLAGESTSIEQELLYNDVSYFEFKTITINDYPEVVLNVDEEENPYLVCDNGNNIITYIFQDNLLLSITEKTILDEEEITVYEEKVEAYNKIDGLSSIIESDIESEFYLYIDLAIFNSDAYAYEPFEEVYLNFTYKQEAKVINFNMISSGFVCN